MEIVNLQFKSSLKFSKTLVLNLLVNCSVDSQIFHRTLLAVSKLKSEVINHISDNDQFYFTISSDEPDGI